jgi:hypothetical protein
MKRTSLFRFAVFALVFLIVQLLLRDAVYAVAAGVLLGLLWHQQKGWSLVLLAFFAMFLVWAGMAAWIDARNAGILSNRMGRLFGDVSGSSLIVISSTLAGLWAAFGVWAGWAVGRLFWKKDQPG